MRLNHISMTRWRSTEEATSFEVKPDTTCLAGVNESDVP